MADTQSLAAGSTAWINLNDNGTYSGAGSATLVVKTSADMNGDQFRCVVSNSLGSVTTAAAALKIAELPRITVHPQGQKVFAPDRAAFTVAAASDLPVSYHWQRRWSGVRGWVNLTNSGTYTGVTTTSFSVTVTSTAMSGEQFRCAVTSAAGMVISNPADLTVQERSPLILTNPRFAGARFTVSLNSTPGVPYLLEQSGSIPSSTWSEVETRLGDGSEITLNDPNPSGATRFYRVRSGSAPPPKETARPGSLAGKVVDFTAPGLGRERLTFGSSGNTAISSAINNPYNVGTYTYTLVAGTSQGTLTASFPNGDNYNLTLTFADATHGTWDGMQFFDGATHPVPAGSSFVILP